MSCQPRASLRSATLSGTATRVGITVSGNKIRQNSPMPATLSGVLDWPKKSMVAGIARTNIMPMMMKISRHPNSLDRSS